MYTKYLTYLNNVADIDHRVKKAIINIIETMRPDPTDSPELTLFKSYCSYSAVFCDNSRIVNMVNPITTLTEVVKAREEYKNTIVYINTRKRGQYTIDMLTEVSKSTGLKYSGAFSTENSLIRVGKGVFYLNDTNTVILTLGYKLFVSDTEKAMIAELVKKFTPITILTEEEVADILTGKRLNVEYSAIMNEMKKKFYSTTEEFFKSTITATIKSEISNIENEIATLLSKYSNLLQKKNDTFERLLIAESNSTQYIANLDKFWKFMNRNIELGKITEIRDMHNSPNGNFDMVIEIPAMPLTYFDKDAFSKVFTHLGCSETRVKYLRKVLDGDAYLMASPTKIHLMVNVYNNRIDITHQFLDDNALENPHFRYNNRKGCLGTFAPSLEKASKSGDLLSYMGLMMQYVASFTPNDGAGNQGIRQLPIVTKEGMIVLNGDEEIEKTSEEFWAQI